MAGGQGSDGAPQFLQWSALQHCVPAWGSSSLTLILQITGTGPMWGCAAPVCGGCLGEISVPALGLWQLGSS